MQTTHSQEQQTLEDAHAHVVADLKSTYTDKIRKIEDSHFKTL